MKFKVTDRGLVFGIMAGILFLGATAGAYLSTFKASAESGVSLIPTTTTTSAQVDTQLPQIDQSKGGHVGQNGTKEEVLTGETASKVTAAALAAEPGATVLRVETDAEGATYEAHMMKADGTPVTLKFDAEYTVTATESSPGFGHGPRPDATTSGTSI